MKMQGIAQQKICAHICNGTTDDVLAHLLGPRQSKHSAHRTEKNSNQMATNYSNPPQKNAPKRQLQLRPLVC